MEVFYKNKPVPSFKPIPITKQESIAQENESNMTNNEIKFKIESLLEQTSRSVQQKYCGFKSKNKNGLLNILQEIKCLFNEENEIDNSDLVENE